MVHRFWACQHSVQFWELLRSELGVSVAIPPSQIDSQNALASWLLGWFAGAADEERETMIQAAYGLWLARNDARDGKRIAPPHEILATVRLHVAEWKLAHEGRASQPEPKIVHKWEPPEDGWIKVNSDGAVSRHGEKGGGGAVLRDHHGAVLAGGCHHFPLIADPEAVEVLACRRAVQMAVNLQVQRAHVELDSKAVVQMLNQPSLNLSAVGPWVQDIKEMLNSMMEFKVSWVGRFGNVAAHKLAKVGVGEERCELRHQTLS
ncbi:uncharacterized protein [Aegilops tauschii subsp. strangulata]|uniref:uncharacterized protein n=1 Tax=Aegilops tauschii subsp. strangulata TaxID=200361 RepID=UPI000989ED4A|nr:uncharacterized protein LOC109744108 [Aegilops tauschii subsp. strangulata]